MGPTDRSTDPHIQRPGSSDRCARLSHLVSPGSRTQSSRRFSSTAPRRRATAPERVHLVSGATVLDASVELDHDRRILDEEVDDHRQAPGREAYRGWRGYPEGAAHVRACLARRLVTAVGIPQHLLDAGRVRMLLPPRRGPRPGPAAPRRPKVQRTVGGHERTDSGPTEIPCSTTARPGATAPNLKASGDCAAQPDPRRRVRRAGRATVQTDHLEVGVQGRHRASIRRAL